MSSAASDGGRRRARLLLVDKRHFTSSCVNGGDGFAKSSSSPAIFLFFFFYSTRGAASRIFPSSPSLYIIHVIVYIRIIFESIKQNEAHANSTPPRRESARAHLIHYIYATRHNSRRLYTIPLYYNII